MVYQEMAYRAADQLAAGRHVLYDAAANTVAQRADIVRLAAQHNADAVGIWVHTAVPVAKKRAGVARDAGVVGSVVRVVPPHVFDQYAAAFERPQLGENIVIISGEAQFYLQYRRLQRALHKRRLQRLHRLVQ